MTRKIRLALGLKLAALLLAVGLMPVRAWAETPKEFYENLAATVGVSVDLASEAWQDKTINAYLQYINQNISGGTPYSFYQYGVQLEALTGYDVAYVEDGKYYINSAPGEGSGGAFYGVECNTWNLSSLALETSKWIKYAAENGPEWPNGTPSSGGGGGESDELSQTITLSTIYAGDWAFADGNTSNRQCIAYTGRTLNDTSSIVSWGVQKGNYGSAPATLSLTLPDALFNSINATLENNPGYKMVAALGNTSGTNSIASANKYNVKIFLVSDGSEITLMDNSNSTNFGHMVNVNDNYYTANINSAYVVGDVIQPITYNSSLSIISNSSSRNLRLSSNFACYAYYLQGGASVGPEPSEPSDDPPIETPQAPNIVFPGITLPDFPDFNTTNNYTPGDIDFTPIIERLDDIDADLELFYNSFNEFRADFLTYMNGIGDALNTINQSIWSCEQRLESVITWLKNIFSRLGGTGGSKPDPSTNQDGFWEWLREMLEKLFGALPTETDDMLTQFQRLTTRFPFSVPWDVYALLAMFVSQPVTPVIDMPFPMPEVIYPNGYFMAHIDLTPYDGVAAMVRKLELVAFVGWLTWRTFDMIRGGEEVVG